MIGYLRDAVVSVVVLAAAGQTIGMLSHLLVRAMKGKP